VTRPAVLSTHGRTVRRLFWTFPDGWPGAGLLLLRLALSSTVLARCLMAWPTDPFLFVVLCVAESLAALLLCVGLGTPVWGTGVAAVELWRAYYDPQALSLHLLLAALGAALALLGPGAFSVDACMFGWRRIDVPHSKGSHDPSN
jgi:putative oxidoreductase